MATPAERAKKKHEHRHGRKHHSDPRVVARHRVLAQMHSGLHGGGVVYGVAAFNGNTNPPTSGPAPVLPQTGHLNADQFVGYPGGFSTDAGNYTGVQAIEGAAGNGGAGGVGDSGGAPS